MSLLRAGAAVGLVALLLNGCGGGGSTSVPAATSVPAGGASAGGSTSHDAVAARLKAEVKGSSATDTQIGCLADVAIRYTPADELAIYVKGGLKFKDLKGRDADRAAAQTAAAACVR